MTMDLSSPSSQGQGQGWFSSALYRVTHLGRRRPPATFRLDERSPADELMERVQTLPGRNADDARRALTERGEALESGTRPDGQAEAEVIDPIARTRAALEDARRQMPGMLGLGGDEPLPPAPAPPASPPVAERMAAEWRAALVGLRSEQDLFLSELRADRARLLADLDAERRLAAEAHADERRQLAAAFGAERQRLLDEFSSARQHLVARVDEERSRHSAEVIDLRGLLGDLQGEVLRLMEVSAVPLLAAPEAVPEYRPEPALIESEPTAPVDVSATMPFEWAAPDVAIEESGAECAPDDLTTDVVAVSPAFASTVEAPQSEPASFTDVVASLEARIRAVLAKPLPAAAPYDDAEEADEADEAKETIASSPTADEDELAASAIETPLRPVLGAWQDFGWRSRPEAIERQPSAEVAPASADSAPPSVVEEAGVRGAELADGPAAGLPRSTATEANGDAGESDSAEAPSTEQAEGGAVTAFSADGGHVSLAIGPVPGVRRLSVLEQQLAALAGVERLDLVAYRGGLASFRIHLAGSVLLESLLDAIGRAVGVADAEKDSVEVHGREVRVRLEIAAVDASS
ncbi:MAG: hypothetical protein ACYDCQ_09015 [Dehalococcoidia bacterium]